jgi:peptidoglycan/LPS O-acetylase OafA/YrhL
MPEPIKRGQRYMPGLDGLRAIAVLGVILYHVGFAWIPGGLLGVGVFFTLSGYLITDILLTQWDRGGIKLGAFWLARARRLLPALFLLLVVVMAWVTVIGPAQPPDLRDAALTGAFYVNNWYLIFHDISYFQAFAAPQPFNHLWSLSVEEQFYILWPFLLLLGLKITADVRSPTGLHPRLAIVTLGAAFVSAILMAVLYKPGLDPSRVYYGTDTRAQELLVGAALAMVWPSRRLTGKVTAGARNLIDAAGLLGLGVILLMFFTSGEFSAFLYRGGFLILSFFTALLVAALAHPASRLGPVIGCAPMRWIGERSYGIYLWHFPVIVLTTPEGARGVDLTRAALQVAATFGIAALSWRFVENPIRHGAIGRLWADLRAGRRERRRLSRPQMVGLATTAFVLIAATAGMAGVGAQKEAPPGLRDTAVAKTVTLKRAQSATRTRCDTVVHIGDSTSLGLDSADYLPNPAQRISAQYARVGASTQHLDISGGRSIYERYKGQPNAREAAEGWRNQGVDDGCWVLAMGTNEAANVAAGSTIGYDERIDQMMQAIGDQPVMWVNVRTLVETGPYNKDNMKQWDAALAAACERYPNMRVYDWSSEVQDGWYVPDGIHFTTEGYAQRARFIADALLEAYPASAPNFARGRAPCVFKPRRHSEPTAEELDDGTGTGTGGTTSTPAPAEPTGTAGTTAG